jgi:hypothetical protein
MSGGHTPGVTLYREIDALGGAYSMDPDPAARAYWEGGKDMLEDVLAILEQRGFSEAADAGADLLEALKIASDAINEMFRYFDGGETRGSYDGKPERAQLRKAGYAVKAAIAAASPQPCPRRQDMSETLPPDWAIERAQRLFMANERAWEGGVQHPTIIINGGNSPGYAKCLEFARYIAEHEPPPVDPLLIEARKVAASFAKPNAYISFSAGSASAERTLAGTDDDSIFVQAVLEALKRGMELAREGGAS